MHKNSNPYITIYYIISIIFKSQTSNITSFHQSIIIIIYILSQNVSNIYYYDRVKIVHIYYYTATRSSWHGSASCCRRDGDVFLEALVCQLSFFFSLIHQKNPKIKIYNLLSVAINSIPSTQIKRSRWTLQIVFSLKKIGWVFILICFTLMGLHLINIIQLIKIILRERVIMLHVGTFVTSWKKICNLQ